MGRKGKRSTCGVKACFHGAFMKKSDAVAKAKQRGGRVLFRAMPGGFRYIVLTGKKA